MLLLPYTLIIKRIFKYYSSTAVQIKTAVSAKLSYWQHVRNTNEQLI